MALAANPFDDEPIERRPGDFYRSKAGTPYVSDPSGALVKSGPRKGEPKRLAYGRPSGFGKQIEDTYNLAKWSERTVALGVGIDYSDATQVMALPELAARCAQLVDLDPEGDEYRTLADGIVVDAKRIAKAGLAAERGTQAHALTEELDAERDPIAIYERGEALGLDPVVQASLVTTWQQMLDQHGLQVVATEVAVVHDGYRMAGTLDRIVRLTKPLRFTLSTGEIVELYEGETVVLDIKTGKRRLDRNGAPMYWQSYAVQIAVYSDSRRYDVDTDERWEPVCQPAKPYGLIAHLDVLGAIAGTPSCELVLVDIEAGRAAADLCMAAKSWEKRCDVFSIAQISDAGTSDEQPTTSVDLPPSTEVAAPTNAELHARLRRHPDIDEGGPADDVLFTRMAEHFLALPNEAKAWATDLQGQAQRHACGFHAREAHTLRRSYLIRGLIVLAVARLGDDELVRYLVHHVTGDDAALFPVIEPGHALGALDADEAMAFALACDQLVADQIVLTFTEAGTPRLVARRVA